MKRMLRFVKVSIYIGLVLFLLVFNIVGIGQMQEEEKHAVCTPAMKILAQTYEKQIEKEKKVAYLTFDDGPSENTDQILDVLKEKGVKATFFVVKKSGEKAEKRYQRIVEEGHTLGLHSYSHCYEEVYGSLENFKKDVLSLKEFLFEITGKESWVYRFPGGSSNQVAKVDIHQCIAFLEKEGMVYFDWNASSEDAVAAGVSGDVLNSNVLKDALLYRQPVILMHDLYECKNTVEGLPELIDRLLEEGYELQAIDTQTKPVQHVK